MRHWGTRLFRRRSSVFLLAMVPMVLERNHFHYLRGSHDVDLIFETACFLLAVVGLSLRALTVGFVPTGTSGRNTKSQKASVLNTTGTYSLTRNPLYLGNYCVFLAITLLSQRWEIVLINTLVFAAIYVPIIMAEEHFLREKFAQEYQQYVQGVPCFLPKIWLWQKPDCPWSWRMVLRREHDTVFSVVLAFFLIEIIHDHSVSGRWEFDPVWVAAAGVGAVSWLILKILKRHTNILQTRSPAMDA